MKFFQKYNLLYFRFAILQRRHIQITTEYLGIITCPRKARALCDLGYLSEAFDDSTKAILLSPTAEAYATRGLICLKQNQPRGAARDFEYAEKLDPREPKIYEYRAAGAFLEGRVSDACDDLERACRLGSCRPWENAQQNKVCR